MSEIFSSVLVLPAQLQRLSVIETQIAALLAHAPPLSEAESLRYNIGLATHELCTNIILHAYAGAPGKFMLTLTLRDDPWRVEIATCDYGRGRFAVEEWAPPRLDEPPAERLGIFLMQNLMDKVAYRSETQCSHWQLVKQLTLAEGQAATGAQQETLHRLPPALDSQPTLQPVAAPGQTDNHQPNGQGSQHQCDVHWLKGSQIEESA